MVDISLIVPTSLNSNGEDLQLLLGSIANQTLTNLEVLLVPEGDRGPGVGEIPRVRVLPSAGKRGASAARNHAAKFSKAEILGFLDDDVELDSRWCEYAVASFRDESVGGVSGRAQVPLDRYGLGYVPRELMWVVGGSYWCNKGVQVVPSVAGMNFCVRKSVFVESGGYNESLGPSGDRPETQSWLRLGAEEDDLAQKIRRFCRKKILFNPNMLVRHKLRPETVTPRGLVKRSLHVGHNRAFIHAKYTEDAKSSDRLTLRMLIITTMFTILSLPRHPSVAWKKLSFTATVVASLGMGYLVGYIRFRFAQNMNRSTI
jgi:glycosyltransferase involved in cell wall biosynthesis